MNGEMKMPDASDDRQDSAVEDKARSLALGPELRELPSASKDIVVRSAGGVVPQRALFDLRTRALRNKTGEVPATGFFQRLWGHQTPNMILAYHTYGRFVTNHIHIIDERAKVREWGAS